MTARDRITRSVERVDDAVIRFLRGRSVLALRVSIGGVFLWFGLLKVIDRSPVAHVAAETFPWIPAWFFVPFLGAWEMAVGLGLIFGVALRLTLILFWAQMAGTLSALFMRWEHAFVGGNPFLLTFEGEFIIKNLVLIAGGLVIGSSLRRLRARGRSTDR